MNFASGKKILSLFLICSILITAAMSVSNSILFCNADLCCGSIFCHDGNGIATEDTPVISTTSCCEIESITKSIDGSTAVQISNTHFSKACVQNRINSFFQNDSKNTDPVYAAFYTPPRSGRLVALRI
jgi:hypothetical protein